MNKGRYALFCAVAAISLGAAVGAKAQQTSGNAPQASGNDVIVTAQRRAERLKDVPASVQAVTAATLATTGITDTKGLTLVTPGLYFNAVGTYVQPAIRGVSEEQSGPTTEINIATYIDGVYQVNDLNATYDLPDVRDVEILKGPQGTLFGRNATGGAILINTIQPDLTKVTGSLSADYGSFSTYTLKGFVSVPIIKDRLAASLTVYDYDTSGYTHNILDHGRISQSGDRTLLLRGKIRFKPWDGADFTFSGLYIRNQDQISGNDTILNGDSAFSGIPGIVIPSRPWTFGNDVSEHAEVNTGQYSLRGTIDVGPGTLTTTTAYSRTTSYDVSDADHSPYPLGAYPFQGTLEDFSQELVYTTKQLGRFHGTGGLFYFSSDGGLHPISFYLPTYGGSLWTVDKDQSYAAFVDGTFDVTDKFSVTGGVRYSYEQKESFGGFGGPSVAPAHPWSFVGHAHWNSATPRVSLLYKVTPQTNVYFTFSQGFKSGLFNTTSFQAAPVNPETITAYEGGIKSAPLPNFSFTAAAFYYDYSNLQVASVSQLPSGLEVQFLNNAAKAQIYGVEFNGDWRPVDALKISFGASYLHAVYASYPSASINVPNPNPACPGGLTGNCSISANVTGNTLVRSPTFTGNITATYTWDTSMGNVDLSGTAYYSTKVYLEAGNRVVQPGYEDINASLAWRPYNKGLLVRVYGKNLTNRAVINQYVGVPTGDFATYAPPRAWGVQLSYQF